jgi:hypothetical protein
MTEVLTYRAQATSKAGFLRMAAANYVPRGYVFFAHGRFRDELKAREFEQNIICKYDIVASRNVRHDRKAAGRANVQLLRYRLLYVLFATSGEHFFFRNEADIRDIRRRPLRFHEYAIRYQEGWGCQVRLSREVEHELRGRILKAALNLEAPAVARIFRTLPYLPYAGVVAQLTDILEAANRERQKRRFDLVPYSCIRRRIKVCKPFDWAAADYDPAEDLPSARSA